MPRRREPTRVEHLAEATAAAGVSLSHLHSVDLRRATRPVRQAVQQARGAGKDLLSALEHAMEADADELQRTRRSVPRVETPKLQAKAGDR
jgi:hypothetical protein